MTRKEARRLIFIFESLKKGRTIEYRYKENQFYRGKKWRIFKAKPKSTIYKNKFFINNDSYTSETDYSNVNNINSLIKAFSEFSKGKEVSFYTYYKSDPHEKSESVNLKDFWLNIRFRIKRSK